MTIYTNTNANAIALAQGEYYVNESILAISYIDIV